MVEKLHELEVRIERDEQYRRELFRSKTTFFVIRTNLIPGYLSSENEMSDKEKRRDGGL